MFWTSVESYILSGVSGKIIKKLLFDYVIVLFQDFHNRNNDF